MKKFLRFLLILILVLVVGYLLLCLVGPKEMTVESKATINAPKAVVWEQIVKFNNWLNWSSFKEMDSTITVTVSGTDGQPGSSYHYKGERSGEGITKNVGVSDGEMKYEMEFIEPFAGAADGYFRVAENNGATNVTWYFHENLPFKYRGMMMVMGGGKMLKKMFDRGLELMKNYCEAHKGDMSGAALSVQEVPFAQHYYAGIRKTVAFAEMDTFYKNSYGALGKALGPRIIGPAGDLIYMWDAKNQKADVMAVFPVADDKTVEGATIVQVPAGNAYMVKYVGGYNGIGRAHDAIAKHLTETNKQSGLVIQEYTKGPEATPDSNQYETNVYYMLK